MLNTDSQDWASYDHLMDFLLDRGVHNTLEDELVALSSVLEHQEVLPRNSGAVRDGA